MEEIFCPVCGTDNPLHAETCRYCGAPLHKPEKTEDSFDSHTGLGSTAGQDGVTSQPLQADSGVDETLSQHNIFFDPDEDEFKITDTDSNVSTGAEDDDGTPLMWVFEEEWFSEHSQNDQEKAPAAEAAPHQPLIDAMESGSDAGRDEGMPEWLRRALEKDESGGRSHQAEPIGHQTRQAQEDAAAQSLTEDPSTEEEAFEQFDVEDAAGESDGVPDWLERMTVDQQRLVLEAQELDVEAPDKAAADVTDEVVEADEQADEGGLTHITADISFDAEDSSIQPEVPEWLDRITDHPYFSADEESLQQEDDTAAVLDRQEETEDETDFSATDEVSAEAVEESGPLAGLRGVLSGDEIFTQYHTPPTYSTKLRASEKQKNNVMLLKDMLAKETKPQPVASEERPTTQRLGRMVIGILLMVLILLPMLTGIEQVPVPGLYPVECIAFHQYIDNLPEDQPVLVALEFEPAFSGEMRPSALLVIEHLMSHNTRLALVSTTAAGPVMGHELLLQAQKSQSSYNINSRSINLGYLTGESTGIKAFVEQPQATTRFGFDISHNGAYAWQHPALKSVSSIDDFSLVIIITDNLDSGRAWIEQAQPHLNHTPLLLVASAQAAPLLSPYFASDQAQGLVGGLSGAAAYEQLSGLPGLVTAYWAAYQYGMFTVILLVLLGIPLQLFIMPNLKSDSKKRV